MNGESAEAQLPLVVLEEKERRAYQSKPVPTFVSNLFTIAGGQFGCIAIAAITELFFARLLGPASRGLISLCMMAIAFGAMVGSLGSEATVVVWISRFREQHHRWFPSVVVWVAIGSVFSACVWALLFWKVRPAFLKGITPGLAMLVLISIPVSVLFSVLMSMLIGEERFQLRSLIALMNRTVGLLGFFLWLIVLGCRSETALLGNFLGLVVGVTVAAVSLRHFFRSAWKFMSARQQLVPLILFGIRGQAGTLASFFSYRLDVFVVNYFLDASQVGLYSLGVIVSEVLWQLPTVVAVALFPRTARTVGAGAEDFTCMILRQVSLITVSAGVLISIVSPLAIPLIFGARFSPSVPVIWWILPGTIALSLGKVVAADLTARGLINHLPISALVGLVLTLILDFLLIPRMGIQGAALASTVAYLGSGIYLLSVVRRELQTSWRTLLIPKREELRAYGKVWSSLCSRRWSAPAES